MKRRDFLKLTGGLALAPGVAGWVSAEPTTGPVFVMIFLRGGADGLHLVAPSADPLYVAARPADLRVAAEGDKAGPLLANALVPDLGFRLHPALAPLHPLYQAGHLAVAHAVGLTNATRSHFVAQDMMERGVASERALAEPTGWLARALPATRSGIAAYSAGASPVLGLHGAPAYLALPDPGALIQVPDAAVPQTAQWGWRAMRTSVNSMPRPSSISRRPASEVPIPHNSLIASAACKVPMIPTRGAKTPIVAHRVSSNATASGKTQA